MWLFSLVPAPQNVKPWTHIPASRVSLSSKLIVHCVLARFDLGALRPTRSVVAREPELNKIRGQPETPYRAVCDRPPSLPRFYYAFMPT